MGIHATPTWYVRCDRCGAYARNDNGRGVPCTFTTETSAAIHANYIGWHPRPDGNYDPEADFVVCPPCENAVTAVAIAARGLL